MEGKAGSALLAEFSLTLLFRRVVPVREASTSRSSGKKFLFKLPIIDVFEYQTPVSR